MKAQDIEFVRSEASSIKMDGYAKRSKLPRKTANAIIVQKLSESVDTEKSRSNYVNVLMEIGISRRSAYRLVNDAYKAKAVTSDNAAKATKALDVQTMAADVRSVPVTTPTPRHIQWPDEVQKATAKSALPPLEDIVAGIWRIAVMQREGKVDNEEIKPPMKQAKANLDVRVGKFSISILNKAYEAGWKRGDPPFGRLASIKKTDIAELIGKHASVLIPIQRTGLITPMSKEWHERKEQDKRINAMVTIVPKSDKKDEKDDEKDKKGDEIAVFTVDGEQITGKDGKAMRFDTLIQAMEFTRLEHGLVVVIHP